MIQEVRRRLEALPPDRLAEVAARFGTSVADDGLRVLKTKDDGTLERVPIPPLLTPVLPDADAAPAARDLLAAVIRVARAILSGKIAEPPGLFIGLTRLEERCVRGGWREAERVASARVDFLRDADGRLRALEVNTTIPAMQGYSDIVARGFVTHVAPALGASADAVKRALAMLPSNVDDLRRSLLAHATETGAGHAGRWALLARANDSQDGELDWIAKRWREAGVDPIRVTPETFAGPYDLVYRHLFARRVEPGHALEEILANPRKHAVWNPVNAHLEIKGMLAVVSAAAADPALASACELGDDLVATARRALPWTRLLLAGAAIGPDGSRVADLPAFVASNAKDLILKRSWDYGGRSVFLAEDFESGSSARIQAATGRALSSWEDLVRFAAHDPAGDWIVQERVRPPRARHLRVVNGKPEWAELFTDVSAFTGHGAAFAPSGLTCRASSSVIVNIVSGGGMAPILSNEVLRTLLS